MTQARRSVRIEYLLTLPVLAGLAYAAWFLARYHHLPQPFFYDPSGTWMDWYSLTRWSQYAGAYDVERTIYPPLSFTLLRLFTLPHCYAPGYPGAARDCDWLGGVALVAIWLINVALTFLSYRKLDRRTALPRACAMTFGFPMVYALERGNLVLFCYASVLLGFGPLLASARLRWLFAAFSVNLKIYLIGAIVAPLLRRRWLAVEAMLALSMLTYLASWYLLGEGRPYQIYRNLTTYSGEVDAQAALNLWFPSTYTPLKALLAGALPIATGLDQGTAEAVGLGLTLFTRLIQALILIAAAAAWLRPEAVPPRRIVFLAIALALSASEAGGYTEILLLVFVFMEKRSGFERSAAILLAYFLAIPLDFPLSQLPPLARHSWLGDADVTVAYGIGVMSLFRPGLTMVIAGLLSILTIRQVRADLRDQGSSHRWRYRFDAPVLPGVLRPRPPRA
ncbi:MAG TPA: hypothetical protein VN029_11875 [Sphingomonas sp.]|nr:hypothetical protein [Sphingomonas sp.]